MRLVSFDLYRSLGLPNVCVLKPEQFMDDVAILNKADWILFPEHWQVNTIHYAINPWIFPSISSYHLGHQKIETTRALQSVAPQHVPYTIILPATVHNRELIWDQMPTPFVAKEPRSSQGLGVFLIKCRADWLEYCERSTMLYAQEYLPIDRDLRLVLVGRKVISGYWRLHGADGFHTNVARGGTTSFDEVPIQAIRLVERLARRLGINHGGFDIAVVDGRMYIFEFNRLFGDHGLTEAGVSVSKHLQRYLQTEFNKRGPAPSRPQGPRRRPRKAS